MNVEKWSYANYWDRMEEMNLRNINLEKGCHQKQKIQTFRTDIMKKLRRVVFVLIFIQRIGLNELCKPEATSDICIDI